VRVLGVLMGTLALATGVQAQVAVPQAADRRAEPSLSAGGEVRQQYERFVNEEWGAEVPDPNGYWLQRYMLHVDARLSGHVRVYGEVKSGIEVGRAGGPRPPDEDQLDLHQAFIDVSFGALTARLGRQELAFGSQRLIAVREGPNIRQTFDGGSVVLHAGRWRVDAFGARYVSTRTGVFDDTSDTGRSVWGGYGVRSFAQDRTIGMDLYYLGYRRTSATFDQGRGREVRHSWGARIWRTSGPLDFNVEAVVQFGRFAEADIRAWTIASDTGYQIRTAPGQPRVGLRADITSGDRDRDDDRLGTFNPMFPKGAYFGLIASAGPSNHVDLHPQVTLNVRHDLVMTASWLLFWRNQVDDGIYGIPGNLLRSAEGTRSRSVGHSPGIEAEWQLTERLSLTGNASLFTAGPFIQESGPARDIGFIAGWAIYRF
jgi:Alginate export